jgi:hypothetical protein
MNLQDRISGFASVSLGVMPLFRQMDFSTVTGAEAGFGVVAFIVRITRIVGFWELARQKAVGRVMSACSKGAVSNGRL